MLITKREAKQASKKLLSVLLAVIMVMSTMSVCFGTFVFAADDTAAVQAFVAAMKCDAMKSFSTVYNETTSGSGENKQVTNTFTYTAPTYAYYEQVVNVVSKLDAAIKGLDEYKNGNTHNNNGNCQDGWGKTTSTDKCTDLGYIERHLKIAIGDAEVATLNNTYNFGNLCSAIFNMDDCEWRNADNDVDGDDTTSTSNVEARVHNVLKVKAGSVADKLLGYDSIDAIPDTLGGEYQYKLSMCRQNYQTGSSCSKTNHYHHALNTKNSDATNPAPSQTGTVSTNKAVLKAAKEAFDKYPTYFAAADVNAVLALSQDADALALIKQEIDAAYASVTSTFSAAVFNKFLGTYNVEKTSKNIGDAIQFLGFKATVDRLNELNAVNYSGYNKAQLLAHLEAFKAAYKQFTDLESETQQLIKDVYDLNTDAIETTIVDVEYRYQVICIQEAKAVADGHISAYQLYTIDGVDEGTVTSAMITEALALVGNDIAEFGKYNPVYVAEVCGASYVTDLTTLKNYLIGLGEAAGYNDRFLAEYAKFRAEIEDVTKADSETLLESLQGYDSWYSDLKTLISEMEAELGKTIADKLFDELNTAMVAHMDAAYIVLNARVVEQVNTAYPLFDNYVKAHGETVNMSTISEYKAMQRSIGLIDVPVYDFLTATPNFTLDAETVRKYNEMQKQFPQYEEFLASRGFSTFATQVIPDIVRLDTIDDIARKNTDGKYVANDAKVEKVIKVLDTALTNKDVQALLGFDLGTMLTDLVKDAIFTDAFINSVVQMLYPLVLSEFAKVFENDLPPTADALGSTHTVNYKLNVHGVLEATGFELYPDLLADVLDKDLYAANIEMLDAAVSKFDTEFGVNSNKKYYTTILNEEGKKVVDKSAWNSTELVNEEGKLKLVWGVDAAKQELADGKITQEDFESTFYNAFDDAVEGIKPLLLTLIANKAWQAPLVSDFASASIATVELQLGATASSGYANLLVPIYEALGVSYTAVSVIENTYTKETNDVALILEAILTPIFTLIEKIGDAPLDTILGILPNVCYALSAQMVEPLLSMLKTSITYSATPVAVGCARLDPIVGGADVDVGAMLNLADMGLDLSDGLNTLLPGFGLNIPAINQGLIATLGELKTVDTARKEYIYTAPAAGKAYTVVANKADVLLYLVEYILGAIAEPGFLDMIMGLFAKPEEAPEGEVTPDGTAPEATTPTEPADPNAPVQDEEAAAIPAEVIEILESIAEDPDAAIAGIVELLNQTEYKTLKNFTWYDGYIDGEQVGTVAGNPAYQIYMNPANDWTKEKAEYLTANLTSVIDGIIKTTGSDMEVKSALADAIGGLFTNKNISALAKLLGGIVLDEKLSNLLKNQLGVDLSAFAAYADVTEETTWGFEDGNIDAFVAKLLDLVAPFGPALDFILEGKNITIFKGTKGEVTLIGYNGYNNAFVPLLEALGCDVEPLGEDDDALTVIVNELAGVLKALTAENADPINVMLDRLPGVLYFIASNGLATAVRNLLQPVYVILDTIRPIYDVDLDALIGGLTEELGFTIDLDSLDIGFVFDLLPAFIDLDLADLETLIFDVCKIIGVEYESESTLQTNWKKGAYTASFDKADMLTVILSFVLEWGTVPANAAALDALIGTDIISKLSGVFADIEIKYGTPNWMYFFSTEEEFLDYVENGKTIPSTLAMLTYPNDWSDETAEYLANNLGTLIDTVIGLVNKDKEDAPKALADLLAGLDLFTTENLDKLVLLITDLLAGIDGRLLDAAGRLLDVNITGLQSYKAPEGIDTATEFAAELANVLTTYAKGLVEWIFFGNDFRFAKKTDSTDTIVINGGEGYAEGLALILEALGCENLPAADGETEAVVAAVLDSLAKRVEEIFADPVDEALDVLPNLVYFLNANGAGVAVDNLLQPVYALLTKLEAFGVNLDLNELLGFELKYLSMADILNLVETKVGLDMTEAEKILVNFCIGNVEAYDSISSNAAFKMTNFSRKDTLTVLLTTALLLVGNEQNATVLGDMLGTDIIAALKTVFESTPVSYKIPAWYALNADDIDYDNATIGVIKHAITYPNNWTEESAEYVASNLGPIGDMIAGLIDENYDSLGALVSDKVNIYTGANIQTIVDAITGLLKDIDEELLAVGLVLDVDINGLKKYTAPEGDMTADEFATELASVLTTYANGLVEWLLFGKDFKFFVDDANADGIYGEGEDIITINGGHGYAEGLALILEALGVEGLPEVYGVENLDTKATVEEVLKATFARLDEILADPVVEVFDILPNVLYFLNANGAAVAVDNLLGSVNALLLKLKTFGVELDINSLINIEELLGVEKDLAIGLDNITIAALLELVSELTGFKLAALEDVLVGFALGRVAAYDSVSREGTTYKMYYHDEFAKHDMITVIATCVILAVEDEANAEKLKELLGENIYQLILNLFNMGEVPVQEFDWLFKDKADTGFVFSALETSDLYSNHRYGPLYTEEMAQYISDNIGGFIDNIVYLLGIEINGQSVDDLKELINVAINGSLYNSTNVIAIRDALAGVLANLGNMEGGEHIKAILKSSLNVDIDAVAAVEVPEFDNDRAMFTQYLCEVLEPLYTVLRWVLADEDISFFVDKDKNDAIELFGAEGYAYGVIPVLEVLECENILTPAEYYEAIEADGNVVLTAILDPLFDRIDVIMEDPAEEILAILPNLIYFINSNGVDTVVKNTLNSVYALLNAIEPIAKIDLYELIGLDLSTLTFEKLFEMVLDLIADSTGYEFSNLNASAVAELTIGTLESYTSKNGKTAYKMVYQSEGAKGEMVTVVMRLIVTFIMHENNREMLLGLLRDNLGMNADAEKYIRGLLDTLAACATETYLGMDQALATLYYIFYGADLSVDSTANGLKDLNAQWQQILKDLGMSDDPNQKTVGNLLAKFLDKYFEDVLTSEGVAPNGFIAFFQKIIGFFEKIINWLKDLFN